MNCPARLLRQPMDNGTYYTPNERGEWVLVLKEHQIWFPLKPGSPLLDFDETTRRLVPVAEPEGIAEP